jgi:hypothetical protein
VKQKKETVTRKGLRAELQIVTAATMVSGRRGDRMSGLTIFAR